MNNSDGLSPQFKIILLLKIEEIIVLEAVVEICRLTQSISDPINIILGKIQEPDNK